MPQGEEEDGAGEEPEEEVFGFGNTSVSSLDFDASGSSFGDAELPGLPDGTTSPAKSSAAKTVATPRSLGGSAAAAKNPTGPPLFEYHRGLEGLWFGKAAVAQPKAEVSGSEWAPTRRVRTFHARCCPNAALED